jgi:hypothetical protein
MLSSPLHFTQSEYLNQNKQFQHNKYSGRVVYESNHFRAICTKRGNWESSDIRYNKNTKSPEYTPKRIKNWPNSKIPFRRDFLQNPPGVLASF